MGCVRVALSTPPDFQILERDIILKLITSVIEPIKKGLPQSKNANQKRFSWHQYRPLLERLELVERFRFERRYDVAARRWAAALVA